MSVNKQMKIHQTDCHLYYVLTHFNNVVGSVHFFGEKPEGKCYSLDEHGNRKDHNDPVAAENYLIGV